MSDARIEVTLPAETADEAEQVIGEALAEAGLLHTMEVYR